MNKDGKIYVAGHKGLVGSAIVRALEVGGYRSLCVRTRAELDLRNQDATIEFFNAEKPKCVILAAAKVGGISANSAKPADFMYDNLIVQCNVINAAFKSGVERLLFLGSSCIYPRDAKQPLKEEYLLEGRLEPTNEAYALAKIAGVKMCEYYNRQHGTNYFSVMPCNLYGPNDNFDLKTSHALPALIRKFSEARLNNVPQVEVWGTGEVRREFLHVDDLAEACVYLLETYKANDPINIGFGTDVRISELVQMIRDEVGYDGEIVWDRTKPDGTPQKLLSVDKMRKLGWLPKITLKEGIRNTILWYRNNRGRIIVL